MDYLMAKLYLSLKKFFSIIFEKLHKIIIKISVRRMIRWYLLKFCCVCNFISNIVEESKYCIEVMKKDFSKEIVMTKEDNEDFRTLLNIGSVTMIMLRIMSK